MPAISCSKAELNNFYSYRLRKVFISYNLTKYVAIIKKEGNEYNSDVLSVNN